jgi:hypothetical protein
VARRINARVEGVEVGEMSKAGGRKDCGARERQKPRDEDFIWFGLPSRFAPHRPPRLGQLPQPLAGLHYCLLSINDVWF